METKGITCKIPLDLHERISEEIRESGWTCMNGLAKKYGNPAGLSANTWK